MPYTLPKLAPHEVRTYMCMLFLMKYLPVPKLEESPSEILLSSLMRERYAAFQLGDEIKAIEDKATSTAVVDRIRLVDACSEDAHNGRIKR